MDFRVQKLITAWTEMSYKEFGDYRKSNYSLHLDNARIKARLEALAQRQQMQVDRHEQNTTYLSGLIVHHLGPTLTSAAPPTPPLLFKFPIWPLATLKLMDDPESADELSELGCLREVSLPYTFLRTKDSTFDEFEGVRWLDFSYWFHVFKL